MDRLKIAVLDSGFDFYRSLQNPIVYNANFSDDGLPIDQNGHGSCIMTLLDSIGSNLEFYNMVILDKYKQGRLSSLKRALAESLNQNVNIINLSLGIERPFVDPELNDLLLKCHEKKIFLITTSSNSGEYNFLTSYNNILSIQGYPRTDTSQDTFHPQPGTFFVDNMPRIVPWLYGSYKLSGANSFLTPFLVKKIYQINMECANPDESLNALLKLPASDILNISSNSLHYQRKKLLDKSLLEAILLSPVISDLYSNNGTLILKNATSVNITRLVQLIEAITNKPYIYDSVWLSDIMFIENLANKLLFMEETDYEQ